MWGLRVQPYRFLPVGLRYTRWIPIAIFMLGADYSVGGVAQWLGRWSLAGGLSLIYV